MCGAACEASMQTSAPTSCARRTIASTGLTVPRMLDDQHEGDDLRLLGDDLVDVGQVEPAVVGEAEPLQLRAGALREQLPRHDVGVVLHLRDDDLGLAVHAVGLVGPAEHVGHEVERLGGVLGEDHLVAARRVDERGDLVAGALVQRRGLLGEHVHAAVDVGVVLLVVLAERVEHLARLLRGRRVVQVHELLAVVDQAVQDREVLADRLGVEEARQLCHADAPPFVYAS